MDLLVPTGMADVLHPLHMSFPYMPGDRFDMALAVGGISQGTRKDPPKNRTDHFREHRKSTKNFNVCSIYLCLFFVYQTSEYPKK